MSLEKIKLNFNPNSNEQTPEERLKEIEEIMDICGFLNYSIDKKEPKEKPNQWQRQQQFNCHTAR